MRIFAAAATIAVCLAASYAFGPSDPLSGASAFNAERPLTAPKQTAAAKPGAGNDSCRWANDNECDDPDIGTGACPMGTDYSDCRRLREGREDDSCRWARDGECDEPNFGTGACVQGSDRTDCGAIAWMRNQNDTCETAFNGACEEPGRGSGTCAARTDRTDCRGRNRPLSINDHYFGRDDRVLVPVNEAPWRFMGVLRMDTGEACTATLIAPDVIVSAAHCINTDRGVNAEGRFEAAGGGTARVTAYFIDPGYDYRRFNTTNDIDGLDWALLRIDQPLGDQLGYAGVRNITSQGLARAGAIDLMQAGYSWDTGDNLSGNLRCRIVAVHNDNTFAHECDTTRGDSGSAFVVRNGTGFDVIGVDSNFRPNPNGPFIYIAVSAASFEPFVADFVAGRSGTAPGASSGGIKK